MFQSSMDGLTNMLALLCAVMVTPLADGYSADWATRLFIGVYGPDFAGLFRMAWFFVVGAVVFFAARAGLAIALTMLSSWAVFRFGLLPI
ncbi:MAG: hypothetical protein AAF590_11185 [Pseudomonadota bacterium]